MRGQPNGRVDSRMPNTDSIDRKSEQIAVPTTKKGRVEMNPRGLLYSDISDTATDETQRARREPSHASACTHSWFGPTQIIWNLRRGKSEMSDVLKLNRIEILSATQDDRQPTLCTAQNSPAESVRQCGSCFRETRCCVSENSGRPAIVQTCDTAAGGL